jgi:putative FmdB family regulatory protein
MPTYDYHCDHCGHDEEVVQRMADPHLSKCTRCHKRWRRLISGGVMAVVNNGPKTLGSQAEANTVARERAGLPVPTTFRYRNPVKPPWRTSDKINMAVLRNPRRYIRTGKVD